MLLISPGEGLTSNFLRFTVCMTFYLSSFMWMKHLPECGSWYTVIPSKVFWSWLTPASFILQSASYYSLDDSLCCLSFSSRFLFWFQSLAKTAGTALFFAFCMDVSWFFLPIGDPLLDEPELEGSTNLVVFITLGDIGAESWWSPDSSSS